MKGPIRNINSDACWNFDTDDDGDVDLRDWADWVLYCPDGCEQPAGD